MSGEDCNEDRERENDDRIEEKHYRKARNCVPRIRDSIPLEKRARLARDFGDNWACIISGCGDQ